MSKIYDFKTHIDLENIRKSLDSSDESKWMDALKPYKDKNIGTLLDKIIKKIESKAQYETTRNWFSGYGKYKTFMEYFQRVLSKDKKKEIIHAQYDRDMSSPCECYVESMGDLRDTSNIIRLKQNSNRVVGDLQDLGINAMNLSFINMKLMRCFYHRIHAPVSGRVSRIIEVSKDSPMFGNNTLHIVCIESDYGMVYLMLIGELSIQEFDFVIKEDQRLSIFDEIGQFNWGSQVILLYDKSEFTGELCMFPDNRYFAGDCIYKNQVLSGYNSSTGGRTPTDNYDGTAHDTGLRSTSTYDAYGSGSPSRKIGVNY